LIPINVKLENSISLEEKRKKEKKKEKGMDPWFLIQQIPKLCTNYAPFGVGVLQLHQRYLIILHSRL
jgi:hypothetical protein